MAERLLGKDISRNYALGRTHRRGDFSFPISRSKSRCRRLARDNCRSREKGIEEGSESLACFSPLLALVPSRDAAQPQKTKVPVPPFSNRNSRSEAGGIGWGSHLGGRCGWWGDRWSCPARLQYLSAPTAVAKYICANRCRASPPSHLLCR